MRISVAKMPLRFFEDTMAQGFSMGFPNMLFFLPAFVISARIGQEAAGDELPVAHAARSQATRPSRVQARRGRLLTDVTRDRCRVA